MAIKGSLKEASLPDVLQLLSMGKKTGVLSVTDRNNFGNIYLNDGSVIYATLVNRMDRIGDLLLRDGKINRATLEEAIQRQQKDTSGKRLGTILVDMRAISSQEMEEYLRIQIEETIYIMLNWHDGFFNFEPDQSLSRAELIVSLSANDLLMEGARKIDEWKNVEETIPSINVVLDFDDKSRYQESSVPQRYKPLMKFIDGRRTIENICNMLDFDTLEACKFYQRMMFDGVLYLKKIKDEVRKSTPGLSKKTEHFNLGIAFFRTELYPEAKREFEKILSMEPNNLESLFYLGLIMFQMDKHEKAIGYYEKYLNKNPNNAKLYNNLGVALEKDGSVSGAFMAYRKAIDLNPKYSKAYHNLGFLYYQKEDYEKAISLFEKALEYDDTLGITYFYLGLSLIFRKRVESALECYQKAMEKDSNNSVILNNIAAIYQFLREKDKAVSNYKEAIRKNTNLLMPHKNLGNIYYQEGMHDDAALEYKRVVEIDENYPEIFFKLGNILLKNRKKDEAIESWTKALELDPDNDVVRRNLDLIKSTNF